jgi:hypothetical protein
VADGMSGYRNVWWERASHFTVAASRFPRATTVEGDNDFGVASARFSASETDRCRGENTASPRFYLAQSPTPRSASSSAPPSPSSIRCP